MRRNSTLPVVGAVAAAVLLGLALGGGTAYAGIITFSSSAPTFPGTDTVISAPVNAGGANGTYDSDNSYKGAGQSFTTGSNPTGYLLKSFTYQIDASNAPTGTFNFEVISLAPPSTTVATNSSTLASPQGSYTVVALDTASVSGSGTFPASDYATFTFSTPVSLSASTTYAFDVAGGAYFNLYHANGESTPVNSNVSEIAINEYSAYGASVGSKGSYIVSGFITNYSNGAGAYNRVFYADMAANAVPEPATLGLMALGGLGIFLVGKRRKSV